MSEYLFSTLLELVQFDQETQALRQEFKALENDIVELERKKQNLLNAFQETKNEISSLKKRVNSSELEMKELDQLETEKKKRLDKVTSQREYRSVQAELAAINQKQRVLEEQLIGLWNRYEATQKQYQAQQEGSEKQIDELEKKIAEKRETLAVLGSKIEMREKDRLVKEKEIPEEWLEKYATMRVVVSNPVVPVTDGSCSACFYPVPRQDLLQLKAHKLLQCRSCYRLLYLQEPEEKADEQQE